MNSRAAASPKNRSKYGHLPVLAKSIVLEARISGVAPRLLAARLAVESPEVRTRFRSCPRGPGISVLPERLEDLGRTIRAVGLKSFVSARFEALARVQPCAAGDAFRTHGSAKAAES